MTEVVNRPPTDELVRLARSSSALILSLQDESGAYPASPTFSAYRGYSWLRDGAFIADGMSAIGEIDSAERFFGWCSRVITDRSAQIFVIVDAAADGSPVADSEMLGTRFTLAGDDGSDDWWDFQLDGYGTWLWAVSDHALRHGHPLDQWLPAIELTVDYLVSSWSRPCFDWWEENPDRVHVSTLGCIAAGLDRIARAGVLDAPRHHRAVEVLDAIRALIATDGMADGHLVKWLGSSDVDSSLAALIFPLAVIDGTAASCTIAAIDSQLNVDGGVHRYRTDTFYGGGQWPLLSCMLGLGFVALGEPARALEQLRWAASTVTAAGEMPEQVANHLREPAMRDEWIERWGAVATPLLWSHAMYIRLAVELGIMGNDA